MKKTIQRLLLSTLLLAAAAPVAADTVSVSGYLRGTHNWYATNTYLLNGWVYVVSNAVLNIEAGTVIRGKEAAAPPSYGALFVCRGGMLNALGTRSNPIIFTSENDDLSDPFDIPLAPEPTGRGLWGGVVLLGNGRINRPDSEASGSGTNPDGSFYQLYEGLGDSTDPQTGQGLHRFGGSNNDDSSGGLRYVSIRYSGKALSADKELNALSLAGVGRGTLLEYVEVFAGADDGFEWWGGAVNGRYLVSTFCSDEMFDMDQGHEGKHQFLFGIQGGGAGDEGLELNGQPSGGNNNNIPGATPLGTHQIFNVTVIGEGGAGSGSDAMNTRSDYYGTIGGSIIMEFQGRDQVSSVANYYGTVTNNLFWSNVGGRGIVNQSLNLFADPMLQRVDRGQNQLLDPRPQAGSPALTGNVVPNDPFFQAVAYKGAFSNTDNWMTGWTALSQLRFLAAAPTTGTLRVDLTPAAIPAGWRLAGETAWRNSGASVSLPVGAYTVEFEPEAGWCAPANQVVNVTAGQITFAVGNYIAQSGLLISLGPPAAGTQWRYLGETAWRSNEYQVECGSPGLATIEFQALPGWCAPTNQVVNLVAGTIATAYGGSAAGAGLLITLGPSGAGTQWRYVGETAWQTNEYHVECGSHGLRTIEFQASSGWCAPSNQVVNLVGGSIATAYGGSTAGAGLVVSLGPPAAISAGGAWRFVGQTAWLTTTYQVECGNLGARTVEFRAAPGWVPPTNQLVTLVGGQIATAVGAYKVSPPTLQYVSAGLVLTGTTNTSYIIEQSSTLPPVWTTNSVVPLNSQSVLVPGTAPQPGAPRYYRAGWRP
jgi:hypothetical protein